MRGPSPPGWDVERSLRRGAAPICPGNGRGDASPNRNFVPEADASRNAPDFVAKGHILVCLRERVGACRERGRGETAKKGFHETDCIAANTLALKVASPF